MIADTWNMFSNRLTKKSSPHIMISFDSNSFAPTSLNKALLPSSNV